LSHKSAGKRRRANSEAEIEIMLEDRDLLVVVKPPGLLTIATEAERRRTLYAMLTEHVSRFSDKRIFIVHRLDREASGLLVFAKTEEAKQALQEQFQDHSAGRTYLAVVAGSIPKDAFTIESLLAENTAFRCYTTRDATKGKRAVTHVKVLTRTPQRTLVEVRLETGRKHQIRVHLADAGYPIVGDPAYGRGRSQIRRMALHGAELVFRHPHTGKEMKFTAPLPKSMASLVASPPHPAAATDRAGEPTAAPKSKGPGFGVRGSGKSAGR
jgi:23S rRNA pseudouridine1911/1915/1917 synthase